MAKPWEKLYNIFGSLFSRDLSQEIPDQTSLTGAGIGRADSVGSSEYLEGGSTFNHSVEITSLNDFLEVGEHNDRKARYLEFDRLENIPEIVRALDIFADEITTPNMERKVFEVVVDNQKVKEECEWLFNQLLEIDTEDLWAWSRNICKNGDIFLEIIINSDHPEFGVQKLAELPPETMYRIETVRGRLLEFQQSYSGPDYQAVLSSIQAKNDIKDQVGANYPTFSPVTTSGVGIDPITTNKLAAQIIRFTPEQVVHIRTGAKRRGFYPYGVSILYAARRIAHLLKLMEDSMVIYRITRSPDRKVFYIDIGTLPPNKGEMVLNRIKDKIKKKKVYNSQTGQIDERFNVWSVDEDFFLPVRPESNTRIETLPGACLSLDTKIPLLDGRILPLSEIIQEHDQGKQNWVYSCDPETGRMVPGIISWAGVTRRNTEVMKITLDNGKETICTPDHKFPIIGKGKVQAKDLEVGTSVIPFNTQYENIHNNSYQKIYDVESKKWVWTHRMVAEYFHSINEHSEFEYAEEYFNARKGTVHHKDYDRYNNSPENLIWMNYRDHYKYHCAHASDPAMRKKMQEGLDRYFANRSDEEIERRHEINSRNIREGNKTTVRKLKEDPEFREMFTAAQREGFDNTRIFKPELWQERCERQSYLNQIMWSDPERKRKAFEKERMSFDKWMMDRFVTVFKENSLRVDFTLDVLNNDEEFMNHFRSLNEHVVREDFQEKKVFCRHRLTRMVETFGYKNVRHFKQDVNQYNHRIVKIERLTDCQDTGTLTVDGTEKYHKYHTFALESGVFTFNSNMNDIDDTKYFREKLMVSLNLPRNFLYQEEASSKVSLSLQDAKFARAVYRLQKLLSKGLRQIALRHLVLKGYALDDVKDLRINFTSPSDWMELTRAEILSARYNLAASVKGAGLYDMFTILTKILKHTKEEAVEIIGRLEQEVLRMQELQAQGQIFAQLTTPEPGQQQGPPQGQLPTMPMPAGPPPGPQGFSTDNSPELTSSEDEEKEEMPEKVKWTDFTDLESDEEEVDLGYEE